MTAQLQYEIEQWLYREAALLDSRRFGEWLELLDPALEYRMFARVNQTDRDARRSTLAAEGLPLYDETVDSLTVRVNRLAVGNAWSEDPPTRTRRLVSNVRVSAGEGGRLLVESNFFTYCSRRERDEHSFVGSRTDLLSDAASDPQRKLLRRMIQLEQATVLAPNISVFF
jgi:3-phenylpropionate/cinnamic acid dioxygenase small subunit